MAVVDSSIGSSGLLLGNYFLNGEDTYMAKQKTQTTVIGAGPDVRIDIKADEEITLTLKGSTIGFFAQVLEEAPLPRKAYVQISEDFTGALRKAKAPK